MQNERGQNTHGQGERVKIPLLPNNVGKKSANDVGPKQGHDTWSIKFNVYDKILQIFLLTAKHLLEKKENKFSLFFF